MPCRETEKETNECWYGNEFRLDFHYLMQPIIFSVLLLFDFFFHLQRVVDTADRRRILDEILTSRTSSKAVFFGLEATGSGFLKIEVEVESGASVFSFLASVSAGVSSVVNVRFFSGTASRIEGLRRRGEEEFEQSRGEIPITYGRTFFLSTTTVVLNATLTGEEKAEFFFDSIDCTYPSLHRLYEPVLWRREQELARASLDLF